jgi:hypothetical protein
MTSFGSVTKSVTVVPVLSKISLKHQELDDTISSCSLKEKEEDDKENATNFSMCSEENSYTRILEKLSKCKDYNDFKEQCKAIQIGDVQGPSCKTSSKMILSRNSVA